MKQIIKEYIAHNLPFWLCFLTSAGLVVGGFFVPPLGVIDGSVLKGVGEMFGFATLWIVYISIHEGLEASVKKGELEVTLKTHEHESQV